MEYTEEYIERNPDKVNWYCISIYEKLSEALIEKYADKVYWQGVSGCQKLSEAFIERHADEVDWGYISERQKLSEAFIERHADEVDWSCISEYQKLSEAFIERHADKVDWDYILGCQKLSKDFIKKHNLKIPENTWLYKSTAFKKEQVEKTKKYECFDNYFIAYKAIREDRYSHFNFQYQYLPNRTYKAHANFTDEENSFGLSVWTEEGAKDYNNTGLIVKVKVFYKDVARVVHNSNKIRCTKLTVLE